MHKISSNSDELYNLKSADVNDNIAYANVCWNVEYKQIDKKDFLVKLLVDTLVMTPLKNNLKTKYEYLKTIHDNMFLTKYQKQAFLGIFNKVQRHSRLLNRLIYRYKWSKTQIKVHCDLFLNPICNSQQNVITILQNNQKYLFTVKDLKTIIETALCNTSSFYAEPLPIKNPYNNVIFDKAILYNIYFFMKRGDFVMSEVFHKYFLANLSLKTFKESNEVLIRNYCIESEANSDDIDTLYDTAMFMLTENKYTRKTLLIDARFPKRELVEIMRPYLRLYMKKLYSLDLFAKYKCEYELNHRLKEFADYNPRFGRRMIKSNKPGPRTFFYNKDHRKFKGENSLEDFYKNHTEISDKRDYEIDILLEETPNEYSSD
jgi:hypothetical protein